MHLNLSKSIYNELIKKAKESLPNEACGLLAGKCEKIEKFYPMTNADNSPEHFSMIPEEQFKAVKDMRKNSLELLAIWHSHPNTPARMSEEDKKLAYTPDIVHVILSLSVSNNEPIKGFKFKNEIIENVEIKIT